MSDLAGEDMFGLTWLRRTALFGAWLLAMVVTAAAATAVLPMPSLDLWAVGLLVTEFSLVFAVLALVGVALAAGAGRRGLALVHTLLLVAALLAPVSALGTAWERGVPLRLPDYFGGLSSTAARGPDATIRYARIDDTDLMLDVWRPRTTRTTPLPVVVNIHGGAEDAPQSAFPRWDTWLADSGHVVFDVDYRFFRPYDWRTTPGDVKCALGWVARHAARYGADPGRLIVMGQSAGGYLALMAAYTTAAELPPTCDVPQADVDAVVAWYPPADMTAAIPDSFRLGETVRRQLGEQAWPLSPADAERASPITYLRPGLPPTLIVQGRRDILQPAGDTRAFAARLAAAGVRHELVEIPYADHQFDLSWGGFGSQIARHVIADRLRKLWPPR